MMLHAILSVLILQQFMAVAVDPANVQITPTQTPVPTAQQPGVQPTAQTLSTQVPTGAQTPTVGQPQTGVQNPNNPNPLGVWVGGPFAATNGATWQQTGTSTQQYPVAPYPNQNTYPNQQGQYPIQNPTQYPNQPYPNQNNVNGPYPTMQNPNQQYNPQYLNTNQQYPYTNQQYPNTNQQYPNQQYPNTNQQYPNTNQQYPNQQYPNPTFNNNQQFPSQGGIMGQPNAFTGNGGFGLDSLFRPGPFPVGMSFYPMPFPMPPPQMPTQVSSSNSQQGLTNYALAHAFDFSDPLRNIYALQALGLGGGSGVGGSGGGSMGMNPLWFFLGNM